MKVEFAAVLRIEFIPEGQEKGPVKEIYFKIYRKGTCGIAGAVLGWPTLDIPQIPGGEGLGWRTQFNGFEYIALNVTIPRLDDARKSAYQTRVLKYGASGGELMFIDDVTGEEVKCIRWTRSTKESEICALLASARLEFLFAKCHR